MPSDLTDKIVAIVKGKGQISATDLRQWMMQSDLDVLGAAYAVLVRPQLYGRVAPPLDFDEVFSFLTQYYARCIKENPTSEWASSRITACMDCANWIVGLWHQDSVPISFRSSIKKWLESTVRSAGPPAQASLLRFALIPILADTSNRQYFADWQKRDDFRQFFETAAKQNRRGRSPVASKEWFRRARG